MNDDVSLRFGASINGLVAGVGEIKEQIEGLLGPVRALQESFAGLGEVIMAAFAIEQAVEFAKHIGEAGEAVEHTAKSLGMSTGAVQQLNADFVLMGMNAEKGVTGVERLDRAFAAARKGAQQQAAAFKELGVDISKNYEQMALLGTVMDGFKAQSDGPAKAAEAMALFGRAGAAMIPFLDLGKAGLAELNRVTDEYTVKNPKAAEAAAQLGSAFNENKVAMMGVQNVMAQALAPVLTIIVQGVNDLAASFIKSYHDGGLARQVMDVLVVGLKTLVVATEALGLFMAEAWDAIKGEWNSAQAIWMGVQEAFIAGCDAIGASFKHLATMIAEALAGDWVGAAKEGLAGIHAAAGAVAAHGARVLAANAALSANNKATAAAMIADWQHFQSAAGATFAGTPHAQLDTTGEGNGDTSGDASKAAARRKAAKDAELAAELAGDRERIEAAKSSWNEELAAWNKYLADVAAAYGKDSEQFLNALREKEAAVRAHEARLLELTRKGIENRTREQVRGAADDLTILKIGYADQIAAADAAEKAGTMSAAVGLAAKAAIHAQEFEAERQALKTQIALQLEGLNAEQALLPLYSDAWNAIEDQKIEIARTFWSKMRVLSAQGWSQENADARAALAQLQATWHAAIDPMVSNFTGGLVKMAAGMKSFRSVVLGELSMIGQAWLNNINRVLSDFIVGEATKAAVSRMSVAQRTAFEAAGAEQGVAINALANMKRIESDAAAAAAAAYKAMAGIFPAPLWGIAAGAAAFAGVMAFEGMASAAGGFDIPSGLSPITQLHPREMVLPQRIADPLRNMIAANDGDSNQGGGGGVAGGDTHNHTWQINGAIDGVSLKRVLENNPSALEATMEAIVKRRLGRGFGG